MPSPKKTNSFRLKCDKVFKDLDMEPLYFEGEDRADDQFEDDGVLHVIRGGLRACFDVRRGQSLSAVAQNTNTAVVMNALGLKKHIDPRVMLDEDEDSDCCPRCGRAL